MFRALEMVTIGQWIPEEEREWISTDKQGVRVFEVKAALFMLSGEYQGHLFLSETTPPTWACWAIERGRTI